jgi:UDP-glucose:glycoprotein glucosyltransferase
MISLHFSIERFVSSSMTPEAIHEAALQIALDNGILQEKGSLSIVEMNLALHAATPKLEAFYNMGRLVRRGCL